MTIFNIRTVVATLIALAKLAFVIAQASAETAPPPDAPDELPQHVAASCLANGCSATIISKGPAWASGITAAHCFIGNIGGKLPVKFIDGSTTEGTLLYFDRSVDMARFAVPSRTVLGVAPVMIGSPDRARYEMIGFPGWDQNKAAVPYAKRRPYFFLLSPHRESVVGPREHPELPNYRWHFNVDRGGVYPGVSGSGIYANGLLAGTLSNNNGHQIATECFCSTPDQIAAFLKRSDAAGCDKWNLGTWGVQARNFADAPPQLAYENDSNRPLYECRGGHCWQILEKPAGPVPPPPPPDAGHEPDQQNLGERIAITPRKSYDGHGRPPKELRGPRHKAVEIDKLRAWREELDQLIASGSLKGKDGEDGQDGKDLTPPVVEKAPIKHDYTPLIIACLAAVGLGKFIGYKLGF